LARLPLKIARGEVFIDIDHVDEMVRDATAFGDRCFGGPSVQLPINLYRVAVDDFAAELLRQCQAQMTLAGARWP